MEKHILARIQLSGSFWVTFTAREGVIIERPLNGQSHGQRDVILRSRMAVSNIFHDLEMTVSENHD